MDKIKEGLSLFVVARAGTPYEGHSYPFVVYPAVCTEVTYDGYNLKYKLALDIYGKITVMTYIGEDVYHYAFATRREAQEHADRRNEGEEWI